MQDHIQVITKSLQRVRKIPEKGFGITSYGVEVKSIEGLFDAMDSKGLSLAIQNSLDDKTIKQVFAEFDAWYEELPKMEDKVSPLNFLEISAKIAQSEIVFPKVDVFIKELTAKAAKIFFDENGDIFEWVKSAIGKLEMPQETIDSDEKLKSAFKRVKTKIDIPINNMHLYNIAAGYFAKMQLLRSDNELPIKKAVAHQKQLINAAILAGYMKFVSSKICDLIFKEGKSVKGTLKSQYILYYCEKLDYQYFLIDAVFDQLVNNSEVFNNKIIPPAFLKGFKSIFVSEFKNVYETRETSKHAVSLMTNAFRKIEAKITSKEINIFSPFTSDRREEIKSLINDSPNAYILKVIIGLNSLKSQFGEKILKIKFEQSKGIFSIFNKLTNWLGLSSLVKEEKNLQKIEKVIAEVNCINTLDIPAENKMVEILKLLNSAGLDNVPQLAREKASAVVNNTYAKLASAPGFNRTSFTGAANSKRTQAQHEILSGRTVDALANKKKEATQNSYSSTEEDTDTDESENGISYSPRGTKLASWLFTVLATAVTTCTNATMVLGSLLA